MPRPCISIQFSTIKFILVQLCPKKAEPWLAINFALGPVLFGIKQLNWTELNWTELNWIELNWTELNWTELNWSELNWTELNWIELKWIVTCESKSIVKSWTELNWTELVWTELNWSELNWTELNWTELNWTELKISWGEQALSVENSIYQVGYVMDT